MKADHKTVLIVFVAIIDCILGGVILYSNKVELEQMSQIESTNLLSANILTVPNLSEYEKSELLAMVEIDKQPSSNEDNSIISIDDIVEKVELEKKRIAEEKRKEEEERKRAEEVVYDGLTLNELAAKLDRFLKNELKGQGMLIASYSLEQGVDPYIAASIMMHETGCKWNCSSLMKRCNNVGGKKGSGCGSYQYYESLESGIKGLIKYLSKNYFKKGLDTPEEINRKYAEDKTWYKKVNKYVKEVKAA